MPSAFFQSGQVADAAYLNIRDNPYFSETKIYLEDLWSRYQHLADRHFLTDAPNHFHQRFWEMYLGCALLKRGFQLTRVSSEGLEYYFTVNGRKIWVEAVAPGPGEGNARVPEYQATDEMSEVPVEKILLRITSVIDAKLKAYHAAVRKSLIKADEQFLLAINTRGIPDWPLAGEMPYFIKALLPFGHHSFVIGNDANKAQAASHTYRSHILKSTSSPVSTTWFLEQVATPMIAVLHSSVDCFNHCGDSLGLDFDVLHNPRVESGFPNELFRWARQFHYANGRLTIVPPTSDA
jgi:hypothetical protein